MKSIALTTALVLGAIGCGAQGAGGVPTGSTPDGTPAVASSTADGGPMAYLPLAVGLSWTYQITTSAGAVSQHQTTVEASEPSPSSQKPSFRIRHELPDAVKLEWDQDIGTEVVQYEEHQIDAVRQHHRRDRLLALGARFGRIATASDGRRHMGRHLQADEDAVEKGEAHV